MGYIYDALNRHGEEPEVPPPSPSDGAEDAAATPGRPGKAAAPSLGNLLGGLVGGRQASPGPAKQRGRHGKTGDKAREAAAGSAGILHAAMTHAPGEPDQQAGQEPGAADPAGESDSAGMDAGGIDRDAADQDQESADSVGQVLSQLERAQRQVEEVAQLAEMEDDQELPVLGLADEEPGPAGPGPTRATEGIALATPEPARVATAEPPPASAAHRATAPATEIPLQSAARAPDPAPALSTTRAPGPAPATDEDAAADASRLPFNRPLGHFDPTGGVKLDDRLVVATEPLSVMSEEYRSIRTGILARWQQKRHLVHLITSATPQEGKTFTSLNLGLSFAELRTRRTIVVEADLRLPQFAALLGLPQCRGLIDVLEEKADVTDAIVRLPGHGLYILPAGGRAASQAVQLLSGRATTTLFKRLRQEFDHIIIDTPPVVQLADAGILGALSDDVLMVVRVGRTPAALVEQAVTALTQYNAPVAGLIGTDHHHYRHRNHYCYEYRQGRRIRPAFV